MAQLRTFLLLACLGIMSGSCVAPSARAADAPKNGAAIQVMPGDWACWRGPERNGIAPSNQSLPLHWSETENVLWKAKVPGRGHASPTVVGKRIILATADEQAASGEEQWNHALAMLYPTCRC